MNHIRHPPPPQDEPLIDLSDSPPSTGRSTPTVNANTAAAARTQSQSPPAPTYGLSSAISGLWRRISSTDTTTTSSSTSPSTAWNVPAPLNLSSTYSSATFPSNHPTSGSSLFSSSGDGVNGAFVPPRRAASPRGLPSLEPLVLTGYRDDTGAEERLLSKGIAEEIRTFLPERLKIGEEWRLLYSLYQDGSSLSTLYKLCDEFRGRRVGFVLVVRDGMGGTFGAYLTDAPHPAASYYGTGECFLWRASIHVPLPPPPSADTTDLQSTRSTTIADPSPTLPQHHHLAPATADPLTNKLASATAAAQHSIRFQNFAYTGANDYCIFCETKFLSVGGGQGASYGLWLDDGFSRGHSGPCDTFCNSALSDEGEKFDVLGVEMWVVGAS